MAKATAEKTEKILNVELDGTAFPGAFTGTIHGTQAEVTAVVLAFNVPNFIRGENGFEPHPGATPLSYWPWRKPLERLSAGLLATEGRVSSYILTCAGEALEQMRTAADLKAPRALSASKQAASQGGYSVREGNEKVGPATYMALPTAAAPAAAPQGWWVSKKASTQETKVFWTNSIVQEAAASALFGTV